MTDIGKQLRLAVQRDLAPAVVSAKLAAFAKADVSQRIAAEQFPPTYRRFVDGHEGAAEETVRPDGIISYRGNVLPDVIGYGLALAVSMSPRESGEYQHSWIVFVDGKPWKSTSYNGVPQTAEITITNFTPYSRRLEVGKTESGRPFVIQVPPGIVQMLGQRIQHEFGNRYSISIEYNFITIPGGYTLKSNFHAKRTGRVRSDRTAGAALTYPALIIKQNL
jgi:hypothetical protein